MLGNVSDNERCAHRSRLSNLLPRHPDSAIAHLETDTFDILMLLCSHVTARCTLSCCLVRSQTGWLSRTYPRHDRAMPATLACTSNSQFLPILYTLRYSPSLDSGGTK
jgi:hypothetical protein